MARQNRNNIKEVLVQWNICGIYHKRDELRVICDDNNPFAVCLQETHLKPSNTFNLNGYTSYFKNVNLNEGERARGGVAIFIRNNIPQNKVEVVSDLQAVVVRIKSPIIMTICNLYLPNQNWCQDQLSYLIRQLPAPVMLVGDFNCHSSLWGSRQNDAKGRQIEELIDAHNLIVLNTGQPTHLAARTSAFSVVDISLASPSIAIDLEWRTLSQLHQSDHFPICISFPHEQQDVVMIKKWKTDLANWEAYQTSIIVPEFSSNLNMNVRNLNEMIIDAARQSIPLSSGNLFRSPVPWWNDEIKTAIKNKKKALNRFKRYPTEENMIEFKRNRAYERRLKQSAKRESWRKFTSEITADTPAKKIWRKIGSMTGRIIPNQLPIIDLNGTMITDIKEVSEILASYYERVSSDASYTNDFKLYKNQKELEEIIFNHDDCMPYNTSISLNEIEQALSETKTSSPGHDSINYNMIKNLPITAKRYIQKIFNQIFDDGKYPKKWKLSLIIPILKQGKDSSQPNSYRPISLTCCIGKVLERIINNRLQWWLDRNKLIDLCQVGFRKGHNTTDHLIQLEEIVQNNFTRRSHTIGIFFDMQKAYDTVWRHTVLHRLKEWNMVGKLPVFLKDFMFDRTFKVRLGNQLSNFRNLINGIPQGSVLSTTLFAIAMTGIADGVSPEVAKLLYVDDLALISKDDDIKQDDIDTIIKNAEYKGLNFSPEKTSCIHFCRLRKEHSAPEYRINDNVVPYQENVKFLGLIWDRKLIWKDHIREISCKTKKTLQVIRIIAHQTWGADMESLNRIITATIMAKVNYGCEVYGSARRTNLLPLERVINQAIRLSTGAFRTSPLEKMYIEADCLPLKYERNFQTIKHFLKVRDNQNHILHEYINQEDELPAYNRMQTRTRPMRVRAREEMYRENIEVKRAIYHTSKTPWWTAFNMQINMSLAFYKKEETPPEKYKVLFNQVLATQYPNSKIIYTDGSRTESGVGCAVYTSGISLNWTLAKESGVYTAEMIALMKALELIDRFENNNFIICSDSKSALDHLKSNNPKDEIAKMIKEKYHSMKTKGKDITLLWIPGHVGIMGNNEADKLAKQATLSNNTDVDWITQPDQKKWLKSFYKNIAVNRTNYRSPTIIRNKLSRKERVILTRIKIGHTRLTHSYILTGSERPSCPRCGEVNLSMKHLIELCQNTIRYRTTRSINGKTINAIFEEGLERQLLEYLKDINIYYEI